MDSRIVAVEDLSSNSAELQELMNMLGDASLESQYEEVDLRNPVPQEPESSIQIVERTVAESLEEAEQQETSSEEPSPEEPPSVTVINEALIPETAITHLLDESVSRFSSAQWFDKAKTMTVTIAGLGGIGSWTALLFARLKPECLRMHDFDVVNTVNMAGQLFSTEDVNRTKVSAVNRLINKFCNYYNVVGMEEAINQDSMISPVTVCGFDNMTARRILFTRWKTDYKGNEEAIFIDGRLSAEEFQVFCITGKDLFLMKKYEQDWLFDDSEAEATLCSYKQTSFCANMIASVMTNLFVNFVTNLCDPLFPRALPFMTSYDASSMMLRTRMQ